jgi:glycosyltransferase involved in cell wall biosynthesis
VKISVVVPAYNEERLLPESLASIHHAMRACDDAGWTTELIVCDNNSTDRTAEISTAAGAVVVFEPINQIGRARNTGASRATGDWLLFIDADSFPTRDLLDDVVTEIRGGRCLAGGSTVWIRDGSAALRGIIAIWNVISRAAKLAAGSFIFCEAAAFRQVGGFSETLYASEEVDLFRRFKRLARRSGRQIVILQRHPLLTSGRKAHLYTVREGVMFYLRTIFSGGRTLRSAKGAYLWYDGRR